jgi:FPC/CPF motif-containing protein YcgG
VTNPKKTTATADRRARRTVCPHPAVHLDGDDAAAGPGTRRHRNAVAERTFRAVAGAPDYPCVGARSVLRQDRAETHGYEDLGTAASARELLADLTRFASSIDLTAGFASFVAVFLHDASADEEEFERLLWRQLQEIHDIDGAPPDPAVSSDPAHPNFAFSVAGTAFFVIGLHPAASRPARRSPRPMLIFNPHEQFDMLRAAGRYERMRDTIRRRDADANGTVNPMVADHGESSEAVQYAGRVVASTWRAPFRP